MRHTVIQGECLSSIGAKYGFAWQTLWNHPENSEYKNRRKNPNVLYPGDVLYIPELDPKQASGGTTTRHRFKRKDVPAKLKLQLLLNGTPRRGKPYSLSVDGKTPVTGTTDRKGVIEVNILPHVQEAQLFLQDGEIQDVYLLKLGELDPVNSQTGAMHRLLNLGYPARRNLDGAIRAFQCSGGVRETGTMDKETQKSLQETYGL